MNLSHLLSSVSNAAHWVLKRWEPIVVISSLLVSVASIYVAWVAFSVSQTHNTASTRPILLFEIANLPVEKEVYFAVKNNGAGPAVITNFELYFDGKPLMPFPSPALMVLEPMGVKMNGFTYQDIRPPLVIPPGQSVAMLSLPKDSYDPVVADVFRKGSHRISTVACYCGLYEDQCYYSKVGSVPYPNSCANRPQYNPLKEVIGETPKN